MAWSRGSIDFAFEREHTESAFVDAGASDRPVSPFPILPATSFNTSSSSAIGFTTTGPASRCGERCGRPPGVRTNAPY